MGERFHIGDLLTITDGTFVCLDGMGGLCRILNYLTGDDLMTHQLPLAADAVKPDVLAQQPWLNGLTVPATVKDEATAARFLAEVARIYGEWHELEPAPLSWGRHDPIADFTNQDPNTPVIAVELPGGGETP